MPSIIRAIKIAGRSADVGDAHDRTVQRAADIAAEQPQERAYERGEHDEAKPTRSEMRSPNMIALSMSRP